MERKTVGTILTVAAVVMMVLSIVGVVKTAMWGYWIGVLAGAAMGMMGYYMRRYAGTIGTPAR
jgi:hypothetical protein